MAPSASDSGHFDGAYNFGVMLLALTKAPLGVGGLLLGTRSGANGSNNKQQ